MQTLDNRKDNSNKVTDEFLHLRTTPSQNDFVNILPESTWTFFWTQMHIIKAIYI